MICLAYPSRIILQAPTSHANKDATSVAITSISLPVSAMPTVLLIAGFAAITKPESSLITIPMPDVPRSEKVAPMVFQRQECFKKTQKIYFEKITVLTAFPNLY